MAYKSRRRPSHERKNPARATVKAKDVALHELRKGSRRSSRSFTYGARPSAWKTTQRAILAKSGVPKPTTVGALADALVMDAGGLLTP